MWTNLGPLYSLLIRDLRYYYVYYWTLSVQIDAYIVTSTRTTETTTLSIYTTGTAAASEYFSSVSETLSLPTPASATSLSSLAGSTSYTAPPSTTSPSGPSNTAANVPRPSNPDNSDEGDNDNSGSDSNSDEDSGGDNSGSNSGGGDDGSGGSSNNNNNNNGGSDGGSSDNPRSGDSGARALWAGVDGGVLAWATFGTTVGVLAAVL